MLNYNAANGVNADLFSFLLSFFRKGPSNLTGLHYTVQNFIVLDCGFVKIYSVHIHVPVIVL